MGYLKIIELKNSHLHGTNASIHATMYYTKY